MLSVQSLLLDQTDRRNILVPPTSKVVNKRQNPHNRKNNHSPVEIRQRRRIPNKHVRRPEREEERHDQEAQRQIVDDASVSAERPAARRQGFATDSAEAQGADGDYVGEEQGGVADGENGVEGYVAAEVDAGEDEGDDEAD